MNYPDKIPAFSLLETVIAMVLIMLSVGLSTTLFVSVGKDNKQRNIEIISDLQQQAKETKQNQTFFDEELIRESYFIEKTILEYEEQNKTYQLQLIAYELESTKEIERWNELVIIK